VTRQKILTLLRNYSSIIERLRDSGVLRSSNNPVADYAEYLISQKLKLNLTSNSNKSFDAVDPKTGIRYQIKARRVTKFSNSRQLGVIRSMDFDFLIAVIFAENFNVLEAYRIPKKIIKPPYVRFSKHQNGNILILRGLILKDKLVKKLNINL